MRSLNASQVLSWCLLCAVVAARFATPGARTSKIGEKHIPRADKEADRIEAFPGQPSEANFSGFGGYITVDQIAGRHLYYVLVEAENEPDEAPVVLWLNGGPGCSSLGGGLMSELGPYFPKSGGMELQMNEFRWNRDAHMLFLESPAFVGFSYSDTEADRTVGDGRTAADSVAFLLGFFERFPELAHRPFFISGESYGGHYVPNLALAILRHNSAEPDAVINLQGFLVGNAWTDARIDNEGAVDYWWTHAIVSDHASHGIKHHCNFATVGPLADSDDGMRCVVAVNEAMQNMGDINIYDIYADVCLPPRARAAAERLGELLETSPAGVAARPALRLRRSGKYDPCIDNEVADYLNRPEVQAAMHANVTGTVRGPWKDCSDIVNYSRADLLSSMLPVWRELLKSDLSMLVYSGDVDAIVPVIGTRRWIQHLHLEVVEPWRPWISSTGQVGGYVEVYEGLTFATVRNAGHMVPYTQPERAAALFGAFLRGAASRAGAATTFRLEA